MGLSPIHLIVVVLIVVLLFGATRLGELGKGLGEGVRNFKKGLAGSDNEDEDKKLEGEGKAKGKKEKES